jgi:hypothetical protein
MRNPINSLHVVHRDQRSICGIQFATGDAVSNGWKSEKLANGRSGLRRFGPGAGHVVLPFDAELSAIVPAALDR